MLRKFYAKPQAFSIGCKNWNGRGPVAFGETLAGERRVAVWIAHMLGMGYTEMAKKCGLSRGRIWQMGHELGQRSLRWESHATPSTRKAWRKWSRGETEE